jgi:hypothetical protein
MGADFRHIDSLSGHDLTISDRKLLFTAHTLLMLIP